MLFFSHEEGRRLATRAAREASSLGLSYVGPDHFLLALLHPEEDTPASRVLDAGGRGYSKGRATVAARNARPSVTDEDRVDPWVYLTPASHQVVGRAEGVAAGLAATTVSAEHLLLALLWDRDRHLAFLFEEIGTGREALLEEMRHQGIETPDGELPSVRVPPDEPPDGGQ